MGLLEFIQSKVHVTSEGCWLWSAGIYTNTGYGQAWWDSRNQSAHRLSYTAHKGEIPDGAVVRHTCDVRLCCNPEHLVLGTPKENMQDCIERGRIANGEKQHLAKLTATEVTHIYTSSESNGAMAELYGVAKPTIWKIRSGITWQHVTGVLKRPGLETFAQA